MSFCLLLIFGAGEGEIRRCRDEGSLQERLVSGEGVWEEGKWGGVSKGESDTEPTWSVDRG